MKILLINKFLYPNGGSETYVFKLGEYLQSQGHEVQYFGMEHENRIVGNRAEAYTEKMDFHQNSKLNRLTYAFKTIYSREARRKLSLVLKDFQPDVCHLNNFNYQLTPSIILEIVKWRKKAKKKCKIVYTAHDHQLVCPNHLCRNPNTEENCEKCLGGHFWNCLKGKCIHGSRMKSLIGTVEAVFWKCKRVYRHIDTIVCCSNFMKMKLDSNPILAQKTVALHNFVDASVSSNIQKKEYVLYFGRYSKEKGIGTLLQVCKELPQIQFIFAGKGPLESELNRIENIHNVGFQSGEELKRLICEAMLTVCPSECYENCPFSVMESQICGTPVLGAEIGGISELIEVGKTGELFESGNATSLKETLLGLWSNKEKLEEYSKNCQNVEFSSVASYCEKLMQFYK